jgi:hypothetical protein
VGAVAVAAVIRQEKKIVEAFRAAGALSASTAKSPGVLGVHQGLGLRRLRSHAVLREGRDGGLYLDEPAWEALRDLRRRMALVMIGIVVMLGAMAYAFLGANSSSP